MQSRCFRAAVYLLSRALPDDFKSLISSMNKSVNNLVDGRRANELKTLRNLLPRIGQDKFLRVDGRLENADLPVDAKHPILPGSHPLTCLNVLSEHRNSGHADPAYTLMKTRQRFWVIHGISSVKHFLESCARCSTLKAKPIRQLMSECCITLCNKPFKICRLYNIGPYLFHEGRSTRKAWGLLFACVQGVCMWRLLLVLIYNFEPYLFREGRIHGRLGVCSLLACERGVCMWRLLLVLT